MISDVQYKRLKIGDKIYVNHNLCEVMKGNWNDDMLLTKNNLVK